LRDVIQIGRGRGRRVDVRILGLPGGADRDRRGSSSQQLNLDIARRRAAIDQISGKGIDRRARFEKGVYSLATRSD